MEQLFQITLTGVPGPYSLIDVLDKLENLMQVL